MNETWIGCGLNKVSFHFVDVVVKKGSFIVALLSLKTYLHERDLKYWVQVRL